MRHKRINLRSARKGTITILAAIMSIVLVGMVAFCVDLGYVLSAKEELQRSADASAMAACWEFGQKLSKGSTVETATTSARTTAISYAAANRVTKHEMVISANTSNASSGDVVFGYISDLTDPNSTLQTSNSAQFNAVRVSMTKDSAHNGEVPYFFAKIFGLSGQELHSQATAALVRNVRGFKTPASGGNIGILPYALDLTTWNNFIANVGTDAWNWNATSQTSTPGTDGLVEVNLFPQGTGSPGNRGTVDIGSNNNSTAVIARQILNGITAADLAYHGGELVFDATGKLYLNGDTGISAGVKDELASIIGQPRAIPIFSAVSGNGNNAMYTIVKWQGIRIMEVKLTGSMSQKRVTIQVCPVVANGVIPSTTTGSSEYVFSPVVLVK